MSELSARGDKAVRLSLTSDGVYYLAALVSFVVLGWALYMCQFGLDTTDEGYYLVSISQPYSYPTSVTQFGFIYHPLFLLMNGDVAAVRQANVLFTFLLTLALAYHFLKAAFGAVNWSTAHRLMVALVLATSAFMLFGFWLPTPNYNSLNLQGLIVAALGLILAQKQVHRPSLLGWLLIGVGGWLTFMTKPPTAVVLAMLAALYLVVAGKFNIRLLLLSAAVALLLLLVSAVAIDGSIIGFVERMKGGMADASLMGSGHGVSDMVRIDRISIESKTRHILLFGTLVVCLFAYWAQVRSNILNHCATGFFVCLLLFSIYVIVSGRSVGLNVSYYPGIWSWISFFSCAGLGVLFYGKRLFSTLNRQEWALVVLLLMLPYAYAFGTNNNYWSVSVHAAVFWVLAGLALLSPYARHLKKPIIVLHLAVVAQLITVLLVGNSMAQPYRGFQPLIKNETELTFGSRDSSLLLAKNQAYYLEQAKALSATAGFAKNSPMIDLTGRSPGVLYVMGADNIGRAWMIGGYPGSDALADASLMNIPCARLAEAWLLVEKAGKQSLSTSVLEKFGASLDDYEVAGVLHPPREFGAIEEDRTQMILCPKRALPAAVSACDARRMLAN